MVKLFTFLLTDVQSSHVSRVSNNQLLNSVLLQCAQAQAMASPTFNRMLWPKMVPWLPWPVLQVPWQQQCHQWASSWVPPSWKMLWRALPWKALPEVSRHMRLLESISHADLLAQQKQSHSEIAVYSEEAWSWPTCRVCLASPRSLEQPLFRAQSPARLLPMPRDRLQFTVSSSLIWSEHETYSRKMVHQARWHKALN